MTEVDGIEVLYDKDQGLLTLTQDDDKIFLNEEYTTKLIKELAKTLNNVQEKK